MNIDDFNSDTKFLYFALTKSVLTAKRLKLTKKFFIDFANEIWDSMEMTDIDVLEKIIQDQMKDDVNKVLEDMKNDK